MYSTTGQVPEAITEYTGAIQYAPPDANLVNIYQALAELYWQGSQPAEALQYAKLALTSAPDEMKPQIQELIDRIQGN